MIQYNYPNRILFGQGARKNLIEDFKRLGLKRPLFVTDQALSALPVCKNYLQELSQGGLEVALYNGVYGNPEAPQVYAGQATYISHRADSIIGFGGGAAIDVAKAIALMVNHPGDLFEYEDGLPNGRPVNQNIPFFVALPTTAGTGSEVGRSTVISTEDTKVKKIIFDPQLLPKVAYIDPELTLALPASVTASTGMDALTHLIEAFLAVGYHPMADGIALEGIRLVAKSLEKAFRFAQSQPGEATPEHIEARGDMMNASLMGGVAFQKGLGANHSMAHALSTVCDLHHGLANAIVLPTVMDFNGEKVSERFERMAKTIDLHDTSVLGFVSWLRSLNRKLEIPSSLREVGVKEEHLAALVDIAVADGCHPSNPRPVSREDFQQLFQKALG